MARPFKNALPSLRLHKPSGQGVVTLNGHAYFLGAYASPSCRERYDALMGRWIANGRRPLDLPVNPNGTDEGITTVELIARSIEFAEARFAGRPGSVLNIQRALSILRTLYGREPATKFGPKAFRTYQHALVELPAAKFGNGTTKRDGPLARKTLNYHAGIVKRMFKWAKNEELVPRARRPCSSFGHGSDRSISTQRPRQPAPLSRRSPWRAIANRLFMHIERQTDGGAIAWYHADLNTFAAGRRGRCWAGEAGNDLHVLSLEGDPL